MSTFALEIITREGALPPRRVISIDVPATRGRLTVLARHQPLVCSVLAGTVVVVDESGTRETWAVSEGALRVQPRETTLLVRQAARV